MPDDSVSVYRALMMGGSLLPPPKPTTPLVVMPFEDITPSLETSDFVEGVLVEGSAAVIYGESNAGKTFWATDLALHIAAGMTWNGREVDQGGVIYCVLEGGVGFRNRVSAWRTANGLDDASIPFGAIQCGLNLLDPSADTPRLIEAITAEKARMGCPVKLVVVDTLARAFAGGNENASEDMGLLVQNMDLIRAETGACVLFIHHSGKDQAKGARGHSSLRAALDTEIEVVADPGSDIKTATAVKQREMKKGDVFAFRLGVAELGMNRRGKPVTTCIVQPVAAEDVPQKRKALSPNAKTAMMALTEALSKSGQPANHVDIPRDVRAVHIEAWRREFYARSTLESQDARKVAFQRGSKALLETGAAAALHDRVWIVNS